MNKGMTKEEAKEFLIFISDEYLSEKDGEKMRNAIELLDQGPQVSTEDIAKAFQFGLAIGFGERYDEMDRVIDEIKKVITPQPNIGYWREVDKNEYACSNCNRTFSIVPEDNSIEEYKYCPNCKSQNRYEGHTDGMTEDVKTFYDGEYEVKAKIVTRGNCMICGKRLSKGEGIFFCKECEGKMRDENDKRKKELEGRFKML